MPRETNAKTILIVGAQMQIFATFFFWLARFRVLWLASHNEYNNQTKTLMRIMSRFAETILAPNQATEALYLKAGVPGKKLVLIYPSCKSKLGIRSPNSAFIIGCDGEIGIEHGLGIILRSVKNAQDILGTIKLIISGNVTEKNQIEWLSQELGISNRVQVAPSKGQGWMAPCHLFLVIRQRPSALPLSLAAALSHGLPIVANDMLNHREFIQHNKNGILLKDINSDILSQTIINLSRKPEWMDELGRESSRFAEERFSPETTQEKIQAVFLH
ncbi:MAG: hypothetical protein COW93_00075 [Parcubacteria group bacterium CG22_combo_CG10-13_8_21_14_all_41_9]|nr:MAG: hypothetical protein COW93_00075 [Parcubacteria group bacterium CG22_combo_CG10-13_8_21_14_all_41_9]